MLFVVNREDGKVLRGEALKPIPTTEQIFEELLQAMCRPLWGSGRARRPKVIVLDNEEQSSALESLLAELEIGCQYHRRLKLISSVFSSMEKQMNGGRDLIPGLLTVRSISVPLVGHLFELAAEFYQSEPWFLLDDSHPMEIRRLPDGKARYAVVMGSGGEVYGLAVYDTLDDLKLIYQRQLSHEEVAKKASWLVLFFEEAIAMSFDDLDAMDQYGWPVAGERAYPVFGRTTKSGEIVPPSKADLCWMEEGLAGILSYLKQQPSKLAYLDSAEETLSVQTISGEAEIYLRYPAFEVD
jgi:hypothetical protein